MVDPYRPLSLYIHVPFCTTKCSYCAFYSEETVPNSSRIAKYEKVLLEELKVIVHLRRVPFDTVYIGGGNPGLASLTALKELLAMIYSLGDPRECTIEVNPESLVEGFTPLFEHGITRMSMGIQSLVPNHLRTLGRHATRETNLEAIKIAKEFPIQLNLDLMTCIPGQTIEDALLDITSIVNLAEPEHISLYNLTVEEGTLLAQRVETGILHVLTEDQQADMLKACWTHLEKIGYQQYEISNFSTSISTRSKHNERYWRLDDYIGLGPSAAGTLHGIRSTSDSTIDTYSSSLPFSTYALEPLESSALMCEQLLMGLRTTTGIDKKEWYKRYGRDFDQLFKAEITFLERQEQVLIQNTKNYFSLTADGFMLLDAIVLKLATVLE